MNVHQHHSRVVHWTRISVSGRFPSPIFETIISDRGDIFVLSYTGITLRFLGKFFRMTYLVHVQSPAAAAW